MIRKSHWGWWPHFLHGELAEDGRIEVTHFQPNEPLLAKGWRRWLPLHVAFFKGHVVQSDEPSHPE